MSFWILLQVILNIFLVFGIVGLWIKRRLPGKDDPRLSRGLQLLQTKISVLEDLSDRTEVQVNQLTALMEIKIREIQTQILNSDKQLQKIEVSTVKSLEVARIFQDRIPHQEIIERQNTMKYVKAARMAHQGQSVDDIASQVDLSRGELEFIAKVNKDNLQFSEEALPDWARGENATVNEEETPTAMSITPKPLAKETDQVTLSDLGERFRRAVQSPPEVTPAPVVELKPPPPRPAPAPTAAYGRNSKGEMIEVRKVVFPKVDPNRTLLS